VAGDPTENANHHAHRLIDRPLTDRGDAFEAAFTDHESRRCCGCVRDAAGDGEQAGVATLPMVA